MRPKIVLGVILMGVVLIGLLAMLKNAPPGTKPKREIEVQTQVEPATPTPTNTSGNTPRVIASTQSEDQAARKQQDLDAISEALLGDNQEQAVALIGDRLNSQESEVRIAAVEGLRHLGNSNAIPILNNALQIIEDPHQKVLIMDTIDYLKIPSDPPPTNGIDIDAIETKHGTNGDEHGQKNE